MGPGLIDLAASRVGGRAVLANDEFFAPKSNLLKPGRGVFVEGKYTSRGKWMDGWETRRRRTPGHDWCIIRLGIPGVIRAVTVDTHHFRGNHPEACSLDAATVSGASTAARLRELNDRWTELLPKTPLRGDSENEFATPGAARTTHVRLNIYPDGGVARLRVWGEARPDWARIRSTRGRVDLVAVEHGGVPLAASDQFFSEPLNLLMPGRPADMGDGWETKRRRGPGHDWVILRLGHRGTIDAVVVDTTLFKGNFPESCQLEACDAPDLGPTAVPADDVGWRELVRRTKLKANAPHRFRAVGRSGPVTHVRFSIFPDGGVARLRLLGRPIV
ncbi:MAG: allantoicase [Gemmatimonadales bacterium]